MHVVFKGTISDLQLTIKALFILNCCEPSNSLIINKGIFQLACFTLKLFYSKEVGPSSVERTNFLRKKKERKMLHREKRATSTRDDDKEDQFQPLTGQHVLLTQLP